MDRKQLLMYLDLSSHKYGIVIAFAALSLLAFSLIAVTQAQYATALNSHTVVFHPNIKVKNTNDSLNWAGYAVTGSYGNVTKVTGSFTVPSVSCTKKATTYAAFWAGLDGYNDNTVEQAGVLVECKGGIPNYSAWTEFYPAPLTTANWKPLPGDKVNVTVSCTQAGLCTATVTDGPNSYSNTTTVAGAGLSSAECIAERPEVGGSLSTLANFRVAYYGQDYTNIPGTCYATINGNTIPFGAVGNAIKINMADTNTQLIAVTSNLTSDGSSFSVGYAATSGSSPGKHRGGPNK
ncbi:G1 family endopeptidase [Candidatus Marsarchaeota archaeon]|nr:G1 family endopeptidase [Candidatus Marsarchaeota archaeon]